MFDPKPHLSDIYQPNMSVRVRHLTKVYGTQRAVDDISFEVKKGEIVGFLGPNGAGKSTTMKVLTCFFPPTSGKAEVCGYDVEANPLEVRRKVGYLPEHNPLYKDMYVREYLFFVAGIYRVAQAARRVDELIELTGLTLEQHKKIGQLSKGYRQRVGLAQAMLHDPEVLILDEPTSGLDPNQLVEIRRLIKELGTEKTVIFSTHIMQEVQALCDRVLIIDRGRLVADDTIEGLQRRVAGQILLHVEVRGRVAPHDWHEIAGVAAVRDLGQGRFQLVVDARRDVREAVFRFAVARELTLLELSREPFSVEDVFQRLTHKHDIA